MFSLVILVMLSRLELFSSSHYTMFSLFLLMDLFMSFLKSLDFNEVLILYLDYIASLRAYCNRISSFLAFGRDIVMGVMIASFFFFWCLGIQVWDDCNSGC